MKTGIKGTDKNMQCRNFQYEFGKLYYIDEKGDVQATEEGSIVLKHALPKPKVCGKGGLHYCSTLEKVLNFYGNGRYFEIEILGDIVGDEEKYATNLFKFIREISAEEVEEERKNIKERKVEANFHLDKIQKLQTEFPTLILSGSVALYLHGIRLRRFNNWNGDLDFVLPYWQDLSQSNEVKIEEDEDFFDDEGYGDTNEAFQFNTRLYLDGFKADIRIAPKERYEIVEHRGFKYKVSPALSIIEAKMHYAKGRKGGKHKEDILEMLNLDK